MQHISAFPFPNMCSSWINKTIANRIDKCLMWELVLTSCLSLLVKWSMNTWKTLTYYQLSKPKDIFSPMGETKQKHTIHVNISLTKNKTAIVCTLLTLQNSFTHMLWWSKSSDCNTSILPNVSEATILIRSS